MRLDHQNAGAGLPHTERAPKSCAAGDLGCAPICGHSLRGIEGMAERQQGLVPILPLVKLPPWPLQLHRHWPPHPCAAVTPGAAGLCSCRWHASSAAAGGPRLMLRPPAGDCEHGRSAAGDRHGRGRTLQAGGGLGPAPAAVRDLHQQRPARPAGGPARQARQAGQVRSQSCIPRPPARLTC